MLENNELQLAHEFVLYTNQIIFLTGKAGTGKTTFLRSLAGKTQKRMIVTAPTGVAAINARGVTLHSFFQLPFGPIITERVAGKKVNNQMFSHKFSKEKISIIKTLDLLIIDEISMVRADVLDAVDEVLRRFKNRFLPFGGVQLLMIGDLQQLPPVVKNDEIELLSRYYDSFYFFGSKALKETNMITIELKHIFRQKDDAFIRILNEIRDKSLSSESFRLLHERYIPGFKPEEKDGYITLTTHNHSAKAINESRLNQIKAEMHTFKASIEGSFSEFAYPADVDLQLKVGAQVMFIRNDSSPEKRYFNGKIGIVSDFDDDHILVKCENDLHEIETSREKWENIKYTINESTSEIGEEVIGTFIQYPLRLAWAITIHKSQGLTFEKAVIDAAAAFAHGQTYVALSRCKSLEGLVLSSQITDKSIICDVEVLGFNQGIENNRPDKAMLENAKHAYQLDLIKELFTYKQLSYRFDRFEKFLKENPTSFTGTIQQKVHEIINNVLPEITGVSDNFLKQITKLSQEESDIEHNPNSLDRLKKAAVWFQEYHYTGIEKRLDESSFETDNKEIKKSVKEYLSDIYEILNMKQSCLKVCQNGFTVERYLNSRAQSVLAGKEKQTKAKPIEKATETQNPGLYAMLREWRKQRADTDGIDVYMVLPNKTLQMIANILPASLYGLKSVHGIGKKKLALYADELLDIVRDYMKKNAFEIPEPIPEEPKDEKKKTEAVTYELYKEGKSMEEIAKLRGYTINTIENHLGKYIEKGEVGIEELMDAPSILEISRFYESSPGSTLTEAKNALSQKYSWAQLKFVKSHLSYISRE
jgi:DNA-binding CsgD family transcriptional regulator/energy-coupling factor transporter ATP-binding protein EcfA2